ncbi:MAG: hypothetical protein BHV61_05385 [Collinsella sp. 60_9]|nr:MAG: hypothetical protein BHV61_05385 [Collinsella sp. 60_9]
MLMLALLANAEGEVEMATVGSMAQVNVRVDRSVKERAEEALRLSGGSLPELIKKVVAKVAQGGGQCEEVLAAVDDRQQTVAHDTPFAASWAAADLTKPARSTAVTMSQYRLTKAPMSIIAKRG